MNNVNSITALLQQRRQDISECRNTPQSSLPSTLTARSNMAVKALGRWHTRDRFFEVFAVSRQMAITCKEDVCYREDVLPWLKAVNEAYGDGTAEDFVTIQMVNISEFSGATDKIPPQQARELAQMIVQNYPYLNPAEVMLFCRRFKEGRYERFYRSVDPMAILRSLRQFIEERNKAKERIAKEAAADRQKAQDALDPPMTYEEYRALKAKQAAEAHKTSVDV